MRGRSSAPRSGPGWTSWGESTGCAAELNVSAITADEAWVHWGIGFSMNTGGTAPGSAEVTLTVAGASKGMMIGTWSGHLTSSTTSDTNIPVTGWVPAIWAQTVFAALLVPSAAATASRHARWSGRLRRPGSYGRTRGSTVTSSAEEASPR